MERYPATLMFDTSDFDRNLREAVDVPAGDFKIAGLLAFIENRRAFLLER